MSIYRSFSIGLTNFGVGWLLVFLLFTSFFGGPVFIVLAYGVVLFSCYHICSRATHEQSSLWILWAFLLSLPSAIVFARPWLDVSSKTLSFKLGAILIFGISLWAGHTARKRLKSPSNNSVDFTR